ncbi:DUF302 domain-containing protein [Nocardioides hungaricus]|jgi:uncharacterized protein (DUF302 family)
MTGNFTLATVLDAPFPEALKATREALAANGFGIITEIDLAATLKDKLDVDLPPQVILGACRPQLAYQAIQASPAIAAVLPCNVVVRAQGASATVVEAFDPSAMTRIADDAALDAVVADARERLVATLAVLDRDPAKKE